MGHSRQQYEDRIRARIGDLGLIQHIEETQIPLGLEDALLRFSKDKPRVTSQKLSGDGTTQLFDLTVDADWALSWSRVLEIEHPTGDVPRTIVDSHGYEVDDETDLLTLTLAPVTGVDNIRVKFTATYPFPDDTTTTDLIADVYFNAIAAKAASTILRAKAAEYARRQSTSVAGDLFRFDPADLFEGANALSKVYTDTVLGRPEGEGVKAQVAMAVSDVDVFPASLFHRRTDYIEDEALGG